MKKKPGRSTSDSHIRLVDPADPDPALIAQAVRIIEGGGLVIFPTRTLYGIGGDAMNPEAVNRVFRVKQRPANKPVSVLINARDDLARLAVKIPTAAVRFMETFWPGRLTIVFAARPDVPSGLTAGTGKIGIRVPEHPVTVRLVASLGTPLTATSANLSGHPGADSIDQLPSEIIKRVDLVLDAGKLAGGAGSTVVDVTTDPPTMIRVGAISREVLFPIL